MSLYLGDTPIANNAVSRNIGEIVASTIPLSDAGLHLLDGALISSAGSYTKFVNYIAGLVTNYPDLFTTEANWQSSVSTYGVCGKFVYDSTNNTVRLPKITGFTEGTIDPTTLGDLTQAGLPKPFADIGNGVWINVGTGGVMDGGIGQSNKIVTNYSSSIYGNSSTVQPQSIKVLYYIVIATSAKTQIEVDIDEIATDLNGKADVDLSNMNPTQTAKNTIIDWSMLDYSAVIDVTSSLYSNKYYTAPKRGVLFNAMIPSQNSPIKINGYTIGIRRYSTYGNWIPTPYLMQDGDTFSVTGWLDNNGGAYFVPLKGAN